MRNEPALVKKIPLGSHGSGKYQKKLWRVVSDTVRIRDYYEYGVCISCGKPFSHWNESQAGHYKSYNGCRGFSKWDMKNIFAQCAYCNSFRDPNPTGAMFKDNIIRLYGEKRLEYIASFDKLPVEPISDYDVVQVMASLIKDMKDLPEKPDYYYEVIEML